MKRTSIPLYWGELSGWIKNAPFLTLNKKGNTLFDGGYLIIDLTYKLSQGNLADDDFVSSDAAYYDGQYSAGFTDTKFACLLKIGDYYYTGDEWRLYSEYLNNIDFYRERTYIVAIDGVNNYYILVSDGSKIYISYEEYEKRNLEDKFWLVHKNKANDKIFDTWYSLTNQVSYKYNLSNASDGVLIKLPDFYLYGEMTFELCPHSTLGSTQSYRTDMPKDYTTCHYCHIKDLSVKYANAIYMHDVFGSELEDAEDIVYNNVINDNYITEAEDIELFVNSYVKGVLSYSNVATKKDGKFDYLKSVYNRIASGEYLPEQILIDKLYRHHKTPKFIYQNSLNYKFSPFDMIKENSLDKTMAINTLGVDYANDSVDVTLIEL